MSDFKSRLMEEKAQLDTRLEKLKDFLSSDKPNDFSWEHLPLLNVQVQAMQTYSRVLHERISMLG